MGFHILYNTFSVWKGKIVNIPLTYVYKLHNDYFIVRISDYFYCKSLFRFDTNVTNVCKSDYSLYV